MKLQELQKEKKDFLQLLSTAFDKRICIIIDKESKEIEIFDLVQMVPPSEVNQKHISLKGRVITDLLFLLKDSNINDLRLQLFDRLEKIPIVKMSYSENMFGFIFYGSLN